MKKIILIGLTILSCVTTVSAKKVKFAVDMSNEIISPLGVHLSGDFQVIAGYASDWCANCTPLTQEGSSNIYSIVLDLPAFNKYEYKFLNGDQFYEAEFVPEPSRVNYNFSDNRWLYVDSIANDTTFVGAIIFAANAPAGKNLIRFYVDMTNESLSPNGIHVAGSYQSWDPTQGAMYHFDEADAGVYEVIEYATAGSYQYKFYNGNTLANTESVPGTCATAGNRSLTLSSDTLLNTVCFSSCGICVVGINEISKNVPLKIYPNPTSDIAIIEFKNFEKKSVVITDVNGKIIQSLELNNTNSLQVEKGNLSSGAYFVNVRYADNTISKSKLIFQ
jgi:hypothetical protein